MAKGSFVNAVRTAHAGEVDAQTASALQALEGAKQKVEQQTIGGTAVDTLRLPTESVVSPEPTGDAAQLQRIQEAQPLIQDPTVPEGVRPMTQPEIESQYQEQLASEQRPFNVLAEPQGLDEQLLILPNSGMVHRGEGMAKIQQDIGKVANALSGQSASKSRKGLGAYGKAPVVTMSAIQKLGVAREDGKTISRQGAGAAYLAALIALQKLSSQADIVDAEGNVNTEGKPTKTENMGRFQLAKMITETAQQMLVPSETVNPETGVASEAGYRPPEAQVLSEAETLAFGDWVMNGLEASGIMGREEKDGTSNLDSAYLQKIYTGSGAGRSYEIGLLRNGRDMLDKMLPVLLEMDPTLERPVSLSPLHEGRFLGGQAVGQTQRTKVPLEASSSLTPTMLDAMSVMGEMGNVVSDHKIDMMQMMLEDVTAKKAQLSQAAKEQLLTQNIDYDGEMSQIFAQDADGNLINPNPDYARANQLAALLDEAKLSLAPDIESPFASFFNQDFKGYLKLLKSSEANASMPLKPSWDGGQWVKADGTPYAESLQVAMTEAYKAENNGKSPKGEIEDFQYTLQNNKRDDGVSHRKFAKGVQDAALNKATKTLRDANNRRGQVFYYGVTAIGNSGRLMISQTELNYQSNKLARHLVDNPRPTVWKKGDAKMEKAFFLVAARAMLDGADKYTPDALIQRFRDAQDVLGPIAEEFYLNANNPEALGQTLKKIKGIKEGAGGLIAQDWGVKDEWSFVVDALYELGKYRQTKDGSSFSTKLKAEADGINNGSSIQGMQFGTQSILKRAGVLFDPDTGKVLSLNSAGKAETMRDMIFVGMKAKGADGYVRGAVNLKKEEDKQLLEDLLERINELGEVKALVKIPLMTTVYGKPYDSHGEHIRDFVVDNMTDLGVALEDVQNASRILDSALQVGLMDTLTESLVHQEIVKQTAGWFFNMMDIIPEVEGANGYFWQAGGYQFVAPEIIEGMTADKDAQGRPTAKIQQPFQAIDPETGEQIGKRVPSSIMVQEQRPTSAAAKKPDLKWDPDLKKMVPAEPVVGNITRNQLAVNGTHNIDATIAQKTLIRAKEEIPNFWGQQVFDAFIGDVNSFARLIEIGNEVFVSVNEEYNLVKKEQEALDRAFKSFTERMNELPSDAGLDVSEEGEFAGMYAFIKRMFKNKARWKPAPESVRKRLENLGFEFDMNLTATGRESWFLVDKDYKLTPKQMLSVVEFARENFVAPRSKEQVENNVPKVNVDEAFAQQLRQVEKNRKAVRESEFWQDFIRQFN